MPEPVSVEAVRQRAERAWALVPRQTTASDRSTSVVRMHFERDLPALLDELEQLRADVRLAEAAADKWHDKWQTEADRGRPLRDAAVALIAANRAIETTPDDRPELLTARARAMDALEQATLAALDGQPDQPGGSPS